MKNEIWIARDKPMRGAEIGDVIIYAHQPRRDEQAGVFMPTNTADKDQMMFFECCDLTDMIILSPDSFPEVTWENSPKKLTLTDNQ